MRILAFAALSFLVAMSVPAQPQTQSVAGATGQVFGLVFAVDDLKFAVDGTTGQAQEVRGAKQEVRIKETKTEIHIDLAADVLFDFNKAIIRTKAQETLKQAAALIRDNAKGVVRIEGHTDSKGSNAHNQKLSVQRAQAVKDWLVSQQNLTGVQFETQGYGATRPVAPNTKPDGADDPDGRQKNRRVEIIIDKV